MIRDRSLRHRVAGWAMAYPLRSERVLGTLNRTLGGETLSIRHIVATQ